MAHSPWQRLSLGKVYIHSDYSLFFFSFVYNALLFREPSFLIYCQLLLILSLAACMQSCIFFSLSFAVSRTHYRRMRRRRLFLCFSHRLSFQSFHCARRIGKRALEQRRCADIFFGYLYPRARCTSFCKLLSGWPRWMRRERYSSLAYIYVYLILLRSSGARALH